MAFPLKMVSLANGKKAITTKIKSTLCLTIFEKISMGVVNR
jgi:hypothetical protein